MSVEVIDFGCRLNLAEGATLARGLADQDDLIVVNSCAVTAEAERQARAAIRRAAKRRPGARIVVTGCAVATDARLAAMPEIATVLADKHDLSQFRRPVEGAGVTEDARATPALSGPDHARLFVEVQNGCDHDCTFCVTTLARGAARSLDPQNIVAAIAAAVAAGQREVVLTGVDLTSYRPSLGALAARILRNVPTLPRLRLSSLDPAEIDDALFDLIAHEPRVMPHVHLSLQSGDAMILKRMKRRHSPEQAARLVERLKAARPHIAIGADLIAGFPTETPEMHANSLAALDACDIVHAHVFPYSPRPGTAAARMPQVAPALARARAAALRAAATARRDRWLASLIGSTQEIFVELSGLTGHAPNFAKVELTAPALPRSIMAVRITGVANGILTGVAT